MLVSRDRKKHHRSTTDASQLPKQDGLVEWEVPLQQGDAVRGHFAARKQKVGIGVTPIYWSLWRPNLRKESSDLAI